MPVELLGYDCDLRNFAMKYLWTMISHFMQFCSRISGTALQFSHLEMCAVDVTHYNFRKWNNRKRGSGMKVALITDLDRLTWRRWTLREISEFFCQKLFYIYCGIDSWFFTVCPCNTKVQHQMMLFISRSFPKHTFRHAAIIYIESKRASA